MSYFGELRAIFPSGDGKGIKLIRLHLIRKWKRCKKRKCNNE